MKQLIVIVLAACCAACGSRQPAPGISIENALQIDNQPGVCPYFTKDSKGHTVLSWVRMINDSATAFCYATSTDGKSFSAPVIIPNSGNIQPHGENLPKIVFKPSGEIIALWGAANPNPKNKHSGLVFYTQSFNNGKTWSNPKPLVNDTGSYDQRYYDVALLPNGEAGVIWLDNRKSRDEEGSGLYFASTDGVNGFTEGHLISEQCCQCCRTDLFVDRNGGIHALYRGIIQDSIRDMVHIVSTDGGKNFSKPARISDDNWVLRICPHTGPAMTENQQGIHFAWFTGGANKGSFYTNSTDNGKTFQPRDGVSASGSHPQITALTSGELVVVWDEPAPLGEEPSKRIGLQKRSADGKAEGNVYLTDAAAFASFPVVSAVDDKYAMVAYTKKTGDKLYVDYQRVALK